MANTYFKFKQFTINQEHCGMKVTTDACLFGAWVANFLITYQYINGSTYQVLDIGTGTALLSLMLAQISPQINVEGVEIDCLAAQQAASNCKSSPFSHQIQIFHSDIKEFQATKTSGYPFIITNPPFFDNNLKSPLHNRNLAMHSLSLSLEDLLFQIKRLLQFEGSFAILLPYNRTEHFVELAIKEGFKLLESLFVKQTARHSNFRSMLLFMKDDNIINTIKLNKERCKKELIIRANSDYSDSFTELLKPYYLKL